MVLEDARASNWQTNRDRSTALWFAGLASQSKLTPMPASYVTAFITFYVILKLSPVPHFFPVKDEAKARPRRCPSPSSSPNNIEAFRKAMAPKALLAVSSGSEDPIYFGGG
jgi:hypothetical protein